MKKYKNIQVFFKGENTAEVNGDLLSIEYGQDIIVIDWKEENFKQTHVIPYARIKMIRISND